MTRHPHWDTIALHNYFDERMFMPFKWQTNDCCTFAADGILAMTGVDIAKDFRGRYTTQIGAVRAIKQITGGTTTEDAVAHSAKQHGLPELKSPLLAQRGDLVIVEDEGNTIAGLVHLNGRVIAVVGTDGLLQHPITAAKRAWRV